MIWAPASFSNTTTVAISIWVPPTVARPTSCTGDAAMRIVDHGRQRQDHHVSSMPSAHHRSPKPALPECGCSTGSAQHCPSGHSILCHARGPVIVEIYTSIAARASGVRKGRSKLRDAEALDVALAAFGTQPHTSARPLHRPRNRRDYYCRVAPPCRRAKGTLDTRSLNPRNCINRGLDLWRDLRL